MSLATLPQIRFKVTSADKNIAVDFRGELDVGELLTGTPTITDLAGVLTLSNKVVNTAALTINGASVAIGEAVQFHVQGGVAGTVYRVRISVPTDSSPAAQNLVVICRIEIVADT